MTPSAQTMEWGDCVWLTSDPDVITARERGRAVASILGFSNADQASVENTIAELAINMLTYSRTGEIRLETVHDAGATGLRIVAHDWGTGLEPRDFPATDRLSDQFEVQSRAGRGTVVTVTKWLGPRSSNAA